MTTQAKVHRKKVYDYVRLIKTNKLWLMFGFVLKLSWDFQKSNGKNVSHCNQA